jgi:hypothetical protein
MVIQVLKDSEVVIKRCESLNDNPVFIRAMADIVAEHLKSPANSKYVIIAHISSALIGDNLRITFRLSTLS